MAVRYSQSMANRNSPSPLPLPWLLENIPGWHQVCTMISFFLNTFFKQNELQETYVISSFQGRVPQGNCHYTLNLHLSWLSCLPAWKNEGVTHLGKGHPHVSASSQNHVTELSGLTPHTDQPDHRGQLLQVQGIMMWALEGSSSTRYPSLLPDGSKYP